MTQATKSWGDAMHTDLYYDSCGEGVIHACIWAPGGEPKAIVQIVHGIADYAERYAPFAEYLNTCGIMVIAEDHMGHGESVGQTGTQGYFAGGWFAAVDDTCTLMHMMQEEFPGTPYVLFGHSMGSFMVRTILARYPDSEISAAVICGTCWAPRALMPGVIRLAEHVCKRDGERNPSEKLQHLTFGSYNRRVEHPQTPFDWVTRDTVMRERYIADPWCGFVATAGLLRDMAKGIEYIERRESLAAMQKQMPIFFIAGGDDPVGDYGKGVRRTVSEFKKAGMTDVSCHIYPLCRHEILNEINREEIYADVTKWIEGKIK